MITDRSTLSSPVWPQDLTSHTLQDQNLFSAISGRSAAKSSHVMHGYSQSGTMVHIFPPKESYAISASEYKRAEPAAGIQEFIEEDHHGNFTFLANTDTPPIVTHLSPDEPLYSINTPYGIQPITRRQLNPDFRAPRDIVLQRTAEPHVFRLLNQDGTQGPELFAYPKSETFFKGLQKNDWGLVDADSFKTILQNVPFRAADGTVEKGVSFIGPFPTEYTNIKFPRPSIAPQKHTYSSAPVSAASNRVANANRQWEENYASTPVYRTHKNDYVADDADMDAIAAQFAALEASNNTPPTTAGSSKTITAADGMNDAEFAAFMRGLETENDVNHSFVNMPEPEMDGSKNKGKGRA